LKIVADLPPSHDHVCFLCQQSAEKYLKAILEEVALPIAHTHDLGRLVNQLALHHPTLKSIRRAMVSLALYAVAPRYPGFNCTKRQANACLRWALKARNASRAILGLPTT